CTLVTVKGMSKDDRTAEIDRDDRGLIRIGELSRRVGVPPETLRAWERRYDLFEPARSPGGYRLYSEEDEARVKAMTRLMSQGTAAGEAARAVKSGPIHGRTPVARGGHRDELAATATGLREALERFEDRDAHARLDHALAVYSTDTVISEILMPVIRELGDRWAKGEISIAQEHFASNLLRGRLVALGRGWGLGAGPLALLACPPGEQHDLALTAFGVALRERGWRVMLLGADTPPEALGEAARDLEPEAIVIATLAEERLNAVADAIRALSERSRVFVAGSGVSPQLARTSGATVLAGGPVDAADWLTDALSSSA
ncbi:MAG: MerR family transcriptional regulator, partial [Solirubrobacterales bacterium]